ncbi:hypothetical protein FNV43_RR02627 [Rhamnella rubrinervis]|uniref:Uncharacterized protein n=1 Tax=Rhamnella rubrinervis TaxID=2594499 RepID=A0A8K0HTR1_9ROSA|nr:hypothetical protein FNV43_RR02627 [Rhamnella rubrinervis]
MPRPPNRSRRKPRRVGFFIPSEPSSSSSSSSLSTSSDSKLQTVIDFDHLYHSSQSEFHQFLATGEDAYRDLQTLISFDANRRMIVSCRRSTLRFVGVVVVFGCAVVLGFKALVGLLRLGWKGGFGSGGQIPVVRRDRSLGGREVVVGSTVKRRENWKGRVLGFWPQDFGHGVGFQDGWMMLGHLSEVVSALVKVAYYSYICKVIDNAVHLQFATHLLDFQQSWTIEWLRQICRTSGVRVSFGTTNTRDTFYRASVNFVLNLCSRAPSDSPIIQIHGEDVQQFIAGLAENIGLENFRAARIVSAAVAASTRSRFLQAWALEMQGKHAEAMLELSKICLVLWIFPPEESAPEMEMVAKPRETLKSRTKRIFIEYARWAVEQAACKEARYMSILVNGFLATE